MHSIKPVDIINDESLSDKQDGSIWKKVLLPKNVTTFVFDGQLALNVSWDIQACSQGLKSGIRLRVGYFCIVYTFLHLTDHTHHR